MRSMIKNNYLTLGKVTDMVDVQYSDTKKTVTSD